MRTLIKIALLLGALLLVMAWFAGLFNTRISPEVAETPALAAGDTLLLQPREQALTETVAATVIAREASQVSSRVLGSVNRVLVRAGDPVQRGDLLLELDDREFRARLAQAEQQLAAVRAQADEARRELQRASQLLERGAGTQAMLDRARAQSTSLQADLQRAEQARQEAETALSYTRLLAPINGRVTERHIEPGDTASPGQLLVSLYDPQSLQLAAQVRESLALGLRGGQPLLARIDALDQQLEVVVEEQVPGSDPGARAILIKAGLPQLDGLLPGMYASLQIPAGRAELLWIPHTTISRVGQISTVDVIDSQGHSHRRVITTGRQQDGQVVVTSGLEAGERIRLAQ
ncbi:MAG: efflux RND transporter periplasmic adaptor subunit [Halopseudomonas yangmingensis]|uniref:RND family efflux transporter, MFP subunit n=1 Tax=Halopseudomonas yangmingensis TaxID=1720063 RepID=A0A1I4PEK4_9GAMM|nr:efflux RND transporter periplasmic adaptor subunit [Halopseudomonas yangmingensis]SFM26169.1 RND family efflux transporter, MFP subunit [Halopseudomonas yangmingensis]